MACLRGEAPPLTRYLLVFLVTTVCYFYCWTVTTCSSLVAVLLVLDVKCITFQFIFYIDESLTLLDIVAFFVFGICIQARELSSRIIAREVIIACSRSIFALIFQSASLLSLLLR